MERGNLAAVDAWIEPPAGVDGFDAASLAEDLPAGPIPSPAWERDEVAPLVESFDEARNEGDDAADDTLAALAVAYRDVTEPVWDLLWRVVDRERAIEEEPRFVGRRLLADAHEYSRHMSWLTGPAEGRRRTRNTTRQAIWLRSAAEEARQLVDAEEAASDPLRLVPLLLDHKAVAGVVVELDGDNREIKPGNVRASAVPILTLRTDRRSLIPAKRSLWWIDDLRVQVAVDDVEDDPTGDGSLVVLKVTGGVTHAAPLAGVSRAAFSPLSTDTFGYSPLPATDPFTHVLSTLDEGAPAHLEEVAG